MAHKKASRTTPIVPARPASYDGILTDVVNLLESARTVNAIMTATYWQIGRRIVEHEQSGAGRAEYGEVLLKRLGSDLTARFGRGFAWRNLYQMRAFFTAYSDILQTVSAQFTLAALAQRFPLPWSAYVRLLSVSNPQARAFYEAEALRGGWSVRQLDRLKALQARTAAELDALLPAILDKAFKGEL